MELDGCNENILTPGCQAQALLWFCFEANNFPHCPQVFNAALCEGTTMGALWLDWYLCRLNVSPLFKTGSDIAVDKLREGDASQCFDFSTRRCSNSTSKHFFCMITLWSLMACSISRLFLITAWRFFLETHFCANSCLRKSTECVWIPQQHVTIRKSHFPMWFSKSIRRVFLLQPLFVQSVIEKGHSLLKWALNWPKQTTVLHPLGQVTFNAPNCNVHSFASGSGHTESSLQHTRHNSLRFFRLL